MTDPAGEAAYCGRCAKTYERQTADLRARLEETEVAFSDAKKALKVMNENLNTLALEAQDLRAGLAAAETKVTVYRNSETALLKRRKKLVKERDALKEQLNRDPLRAEEVKVVLTEMSELYRKLAAAEAELDALRAALKES
jgi:chromosome segregation ATPase